VGKKSLSVSPRSFFTAIRQNSALKQLVFVFVASVKLSHTLHILRSVRILVSLELNTSRELETI
jgi:hypothetical protein